MAKPATMTRMPEVQVQAQDSSIKNLKSIDRKSTLIVLPCSGSKASGGTNLMGSAPSTWSAELQRARVRMHVKAEVDEYSLMPAWLRYTGGIYQNAGSTLAEAVKNGAHIVILSGGY